MVEISILSCWNWVETLNYGWILRGWLSFSKEFMTLVLRIQHCQSEPGLRLIWTKLPNKKLSWIFCKKFVFIFWVSQIFLPTSDFAFSHLFTCKFPSGFSRNILTIEKCSHHVSTLAGFGQILYKTMPWIHFPFASRNGWVDYGLWNNKK